MDNYPRLFRECVVPNHDSSVYAIVVWSCGEVENEAIVAWAICEILDEDGLTTGQVIVHPITQTGETPGASCRVGVVFMGRVTDEDAAYADRDEFVAKAKKQMAEREADRKTAAERKVADADRD